MSLLRKCKKCGIEANTAEELDFFPVDTSSKHGRRNKCKKCFREGRQEYSRNYSREWFRRNPDKSRNSMLKQYYGITLDDYDKMLFAQEGECAVCNRHHTESKKPLYVDHCHTTGAVRGLLCHTCNSGIGMLNDDLDMLYSACEYLEQYKHGRQI